MHARIKVSARKLAVWGLAASVVASAGIATASPDAAEVRASQKQTSAKRSAQGAQEKRKPRVVVLTTGGTIAGAASTRGDGAYDAGKVSGDQLIEAVPGLRELAELRVESVSTIGSQDMNEGVWLDLVRHVAAALESGETDGVVITHGTDTLEETAFFLDLVLRTDKPIVLVGSMRPSSAVSADGPQNLFEAVHTASSPSSRGRGVLVVLNDEIHAARSVQKMNTTSVQTFASPNGGPEGFVDAAGGVRFLRPASRAARVTYRVPAHGRLPRVDIVYSHAEMDGKAIDDAVARGARGIVLAGVGDGNSSKVALEAMQRASRAGVIAVRASRVGAGFVNRNVEASDDELGTVASLDLSPQKARILTQLLIANGVTDPARVQAAFEATH